MTPYYESGGITIYHGDCRDVLPKLPLSPLILTDIPYAEATRESAGLRNLNRGNADSPTFQIDEWLPLVCGRMSGSLYVWCGFQQFSEIDRFFRKRGLSRRCLVWEKTNPSPMNGQYLWLSGIELCAYGKMALATFNGFCLNTVLRGPTSPPNGHPTPKPEWLMGTLIQVSSNVGDLILDPCCGSGSVLRAAKELGRCAIGIEIEEKYCEIAARRLDQEVLAL